MLVTKHAKINSMLTGKPPQIKKKKKTISSRHLLVMTPMIATIAAKLPSKLNFLNGLKQHTKFAKRMRKHLHVQMLMKSEPKLKKDVLVMVQMEAKTSTPK